MTQSRLYDEFHFSEKEFNKIDAHKKVSTLKTG